MVLFYYSHFLNGKTESQKGQATCPKTRKINGKVSSFGPQSQSLSATAVSSRCKASPRSARQLYIPCLSGHSTLERAQ